MGEAQEVEWQGEKDGNTFNSLLLGKGDIDLAVRAVLARFIGLFHPIMPSVVIIVYLFMLSIQVEITDQLDYLAMCRGSV